MPSAERAPASVVPFSPRVWPISIAPPLPPFGPPRAASHRVLRHTCALRTVTLPPCRAPSRPPLLARRDVGPRQRAA